MTLAIVVKGTEGVVLAVDSRVTLTGAAIPWQLLPLQDCVDVAILAVKTTAEIQKFVTDIRGVGGPIDVAVITKIDGFRYLQSKSLRGEYDSKRI